MLYDIVVLKCSNTWNALLIKPLCVASVPTFTDGTDTLPPPLSTETLASLTDSINTFPPADVMSMETKRGGAVTST